MPKQVITGGLSDRSFERSVKSKILSARPTSLGIAVAYVSIYGFQALRRLVEDAGVTEIRLVTDVGDAITHPEALRGALNSGWIVRVVDPQAGTFHPKMIIAGRIFNDRALLEETRLSLVGSANLTKGGLVSNVECGVLSTSDALSAEFARTFSKLWRKGAELNEDMLEQYEAKFAEVNRKRAPKDLEILGVADEFDVEKFDKTELRRRPAPRPTERSIRNAAARAAWAGLESFTGEYRFQVEFPRDAGEVLGRILHSRGSNSEVKVVSEDDITRNMTYKYYEDNGMFRLNVPNDTPGVDWARENHAGLAVVHAATHEDAPLHFRIIKPGKEADDVVGRSVALGTWGKTRTRLYGWF